MEHLDFQYITLILILFGAQNIVGKEKWTDCAANEFQDAIYVHQLVVAPLPIRLPGTYNISFDAVVSLYVPEMVIDVEIGMQNSTGDWERVYPVEENKTLRVYDSCRLINKLLFSNPAAIEKDIDIQIDKLFVHAVRYHAGCPLLAGRIVFQSRPIEIPVDLIPLNSLPKDRYLVKITFNGLAQKYLGCVQFHVNYEGQVIN